MPRKSSPSENLEVWEVGMARLTLRCETAMFHT